MTKMIWLCEDEATFYRVFSEKERKFLSDAYFGDGRVHKKTELTPGNDAEYIFSTWGMPVFTEDEIRSIFPKARGLFYGAGSVKPFASQFLACGIPVYSAWQANAIPVVEVAVSEIMLATKGYFRIQPLCKTDRSKSWEIFENYPGNYNVKVGIIGFGAIGRRVTAELLRHDIEVLVYAPEITAETAPEYGVTAADLPTIFSECTVISNHLPNLPSLCKTINSELFDRMMPYSTFINTGRGAQVDEDALCKKLVEDPTITAILDVTFPEPPDADSALLKLPNVLMTPHFAGSSGREVCRMAHYMVEEAARVTKGDTPLYSVSAEMLEHMA